jgi:hypothetical protein
LHALPSQCDARRRLEHPRRLLGRVYRHVLDPRLPAVAAVVLNGKIYVIGGDSGESRIKNMEVYTPE